MNIELCKFRVKKGKEKKAREWMEFLRNNRDAIILTLDDEKMYVESIFEEEDGEYLFLYWYSVQGDGGHAVEQSNHEVDLVHISYWKECIDESFEGVKIKHHISMIPERIVQSFCTNMALDR